MAGYRVTIERLGGDNPFTVIFLAEELPHALAQAMEMTCHPRLVTGLLPQTALNVMDWNDNYQADSWPGEEEVLNAFWHAAQALVDGWKRQDDKLEAAVRGG